MARTVVGTSVGPSERLCCVDRLSRHHFSDVPAAAEMSVHWAKADIRLRASGSDFDPRVRPVKAHGGGWSNLWRLSAPDRWASFIRKKFGINTKSPLV